jgi:cytochrome P450
VENLESKIDNNVRALVRLLETKYAATGQPFDMGKKVQFFTMDTISDISFGEPIGFLASDSDKYQYCEAFEKQMPTLIVTTVLPVLVKILQWPLVKKLGPSDRDPLGFGKLLGLAKGVAAKRYAPEAKPRRDMVGSFIAHGLTFEEAESEILLQILAGSDTTATAIRTTLLYVMTNLRVLATLRAEIADKGSDVSSPGEDVPAVVSDATARSMPYLQAVIREGLRVHPPITGIQTKLVPAGGDTYKGVFLPEGTELGHCVWGSMRRAETWGVDAAEFRPERWIEANPDQFREMEATLDLVFSHGRWQCLGKSIAMMELNKVIFEVSTLPFVYKMPGQRLKHTGAC